MTYVVQTNKLTKTIGEKNLVTNVSMHVKKGEICPVQRALLRAWRWRTPSALVTIC